MTVPSPMPCHHGLPDPRAALQTAIAVELRHIGATLEQLALVLVGDDHFVRDHLDQLQQFDLLAQWTDESAAVLDRLAGGADAQAAVAPVRLRLIQDRLRAALPTPAP